MVFDFMETGKLSWLLVEICTICMTSWRKTFSFLNSVDVEAVNGGVFFG